MSDRLQSYRVPLAIIAALGLFSAAMAVLITSSVQAQVATDFNLSISDGGLPQAGGNSDVTLAINPGDSTIAAIGATVSYDAASIEPTACVVLVGLGACNIDTVGVVNVQTVDPNGWASATDLFRLSFSSLSLGDTTPLDVNVTEAYDVTGTLIGGVVDDGEIIFRLNGDANCSGSVTIADALFVAQFAVQTRNAVSSCPLDPATEIDTRWADISGDGNISILDALMIAQCAVQSRDCEA